VWDGLAEGGELIEMQHKGAISGIAVKLCLGWQSLFSNHKIIEHEGTN
jgi:hypothetical protein